ncbi:glycosyltransferase family 61 protein [Mucilaginibacter conchicola]|uniref:Glycosyltransferase family 61 protein n=1 Tax=Mucilaginibacter conchicola TaxID=2303333 RepID=A0A372NPU7_9SPHI|nr:glycosyltransferase family 61 protein [Mucilaginibacter conchicola]RFZ90395.1 glycosyltransferase family 61 protein [Mucilaginibacter conchicola]
MIIQPPLQINRAFPENYTEGELDFCKGEFTYQTEQLEILSLDKVFVDFNGRVYNRDFKVEERSLIEGQPFKRSGFLSRLKKLYLKNKRNLSQGDTYLHCFNAWSSNHYHWIVDFLPKLTLVIDELPNYVLLLPDSDYARQTGAKLLETFNLKPKRIEWIKPKQFVAAHNLKFIPPIVATGKTHDELMLKLRSRLRFDNPNPQERIYVTRRKAASRKVLNEDKVIELLQRYNFKTIAFEELSIEEQVKTMANTKVMISIHGAGITNSIFMPPSGSIIEFRRNKVYHNQCYWHLAKAIQLNYYYLFGAPDGEGVIEGPQGVNLTIPLDKLEEIAKVICH